MLHKVGKERQLIWIKYQDISNERFMHEKNAHVLIRWHLCRKPCAPLNPADVFSALIFGVRIASRYVGDRKIMSYPRRSTLKSGKVASLTGQQGKQTVSQLSHQVL